MGCKSCEFTRRSWKVDRVEGVIEILTERAHSMLRVVMQSAALPQDGDAMEGMPRMLMARNMRTQSWWRGARECSADSEDALSTSLACRIACPHG
eukprot:3521689-Rhodomonas_salina.1